ncbi:MAG: RDD family protein [Clostridia bacterium]|nr:RDD family protein [Clostridia bacterium]
MIYDIQKANIWKRASAYLFDTIILAIIVIAFSFTLSFITGYDSYNTALSEYQKSYEEKYNVSFSLSLEEFEALGENELAVYNEANAAFSTDPDVIYTYNMVINLSLLIISLSFLFAILIYEFTIPLFLKNGQTLGKKIFGIGLMKSDGVKVNSVSLLVRALLGKYTVETMIPLFIAMMVFLGSLGILGTVIIIAILLLQIIMLCVTQTNSAIHDLLANTVVVDIQSQMIFDSENDLIEYKKRVAKEAASDRKY